MSRFSNKAHILQWIDSRLVVPACSVLTLVRRLVDRSGSAPQPRNPGRILFLKLAEQGSTVLAHEAIRLATERVGRENVYFLAFEENRFILDLLNLIPEENVLTIRTKSALTMATSCLERLSEIRALRFSVCIDMEFFARSTAVIAYLTGAPSRVGFHAYFGEGPYRGDLFTHRVLYNPHLHASSTFTSLVMALDVKPEDFPTFNAKPRPTVAPPLFQPSEAEQAAVREIFTSLGIPHGSRLVLLNANASDLLPLRRWEPANYVALGKRLLEEFPDIHIGFTGAPDEAPKIQKLVDALGSPRSHCLAGRTTLRQLLIVYNMADLLVTNDSGPAHFAALTGIDVVTLFGPETPLLFGSPSPRNHSIWAGIACSPCVSALNNRQSACRNNLCMQVLSVDLVFDTARRVFRDRLKRGEPAPAIS